MFRNQGSFWSYFYELYINCSHILTGYKQSVTGCGSQRRQCSCYSTKTHVNSMILILKLNLTSLKNIYIKSGLRWAPYTFLGSFNVSKRKPLRKTSQWLISKHSQVCFTIQNVRWFLFEVRKSHNNVIVIEQLLIVTCDFIGRRSPLPHAYSRRRDFVSQIALVRMEYNGRKYFGCWRCPSSPQGHFGDCASRYFLYIQSVMSSA